MVHDDLAVFNAFLSVMKVIWCLVPSRDWKLLAFFLTLSHVKHWTRLRMDPSKISEITLRKRDCFFFFLVLRSIWAIGQTIMTVIQCKAKYNFFNIYAVFSYMREANLSWTYKWVQLWGGWILVGCWRVWSGVRAHCEWGYRDERMNNAWRLHYQVLQ